MGYTRGGTLPAGITFFGRAWDEATLIKLAYAYEQATKHRRPPATTPPLPPRRAGARGTIPQPLSPTAQATLGFDEHHVVFFQHREELVFQFPLP